MFEVLIDDFFMTVNSTAGLKPIDRKKVLSLMNDFEDGAWRHGNFQNFIWDNIAETSLSAKERHSLTGKARSQLTEAAKNLRLTDEKVEIGQGSELAEIVLYGVMKHHYKALPVVPKIFYKQNANDNAKGADSVHIVLDDAGDFSLWFGEAKFYNSIEDPRLACVIDSVAQSLKTEKLKKENSIITNVSELDILIGDEKLRAAIRQALSNQNSIDLLKPKIHIPILLLHECEITSRQKEMTDGYKTELATYHRDRANAYFSAQIKKLASISKYSEVSFHLIVLPVPNKKKVVDAFLEDVKHYKGKNNGSV